MTADVIRFQKPKPDQVKKPPAKQLRLTTKQTRNEWTAVLAQIWANSKNWKRSRKGNAFILIDDLDICVVIIHRDDGKFQWQIRWRDIEGPITSRWIYDVEQTSIDEAWIALAAVA